MCTVPTIDGGGGQRGVGVSRPGGLVWAGARGRGGVGFPTAGRSGRIRRGTWLGRVTGRLACLGWVLGLTDIIIEGRGEISLSVS